MKRRLIDGEEQIFSLTEETDLFRLRIGTSEVKEKHVEEFMDKTVEWLSTNPEKGILIDLDGVKSVCSDFTIALTRYYENVKRHGLYVRFVNVDPDIQPYVDVSNITVVMTRPKRLTISAREVMGDIESNLSDNELMKKHNLSPRGLMKLYKKLRAKGLEFRGALERRIGGQRTDHNLVLQTKDAKKVTVNASDVLKSLSNGMTDDQLMSHYKLSLRGLQSLYLKLNNLGLISESTLRRRRDSWEKTPHSQQ
jgi:anti-anti-sigma regulatory factor